VIVETEYGKVAGFTENKVNYFLGIPFAAPPVNELRWRSPRPPERYGKKPYDASYFRAECMQGKLHNSGAWVDGYRKMSFETTLTHLSPIRHRRQTDRRC
jgi:carboxylesterase type B